MTKSILDTVEGIGPKRKKKLMNHFKSIKKMKQASVEQLEQVVPKEVAERLYRRFHENEQKDML